MNRTASAQPPWIPDSAPRFRDDNLWAGSL